jgi:hypothetical protein
MDDRDKYIQELEKLSEMKDSLINLLKNQIEGYKKTIANQDRMMEILKELVSRREGRN